MTKALAIAAKTARPTCPNQVSPATISRIPSASGIRSGARPEAKAIRAEEEAETLIAIVRTKSTISAPIG